MTKQAWSSFVLGLILTLGGGCRRQSATWPATPTESAIPISTARPASQIIANPTGFPTPSSPPAATPTEVTTPLPTLTLPVDWFEIDDEELGLTLSLPADWLAIARSDERFGPGTLLVVDSEETAVRWQSTGDLDSGAFLLALDLEQITGINAVGPLDPIVTLDNFVGQDVVPLGTPPETILIGDMVGATARVTGDPTALLGEMGSNLPLQLLLLVEPSQQRPILFVMGTAPSQIGRYDQLFANLMASITLRPVVAADIVAHLGFGALRSNLLLPDTVDIWRFEGQAGQYLNLGVRTDDDLDLVVSLISPSRQTLAEVDRGYAGDSETIFDYLLVESGTYEVVVYDFFNDWGQYTLSVSQVAEPQYGGGGGIRPGETVSSELDGQQGEIWTFPALAGDTISAVLAPTTQELDLFLKLRDPAGTPLLTLDESYGGDPEIVAGFVLPMSGEYQLEVGSFGQYSGGYNLSLEYGDNPTTNFYDAGDLHYGDELTATLLTGEMHAWFFHGHEGQKMTLSVSPLDQALDIDVWLLGPQLERLAMQDEQLLGEPETIEFALVHDGQHIALVREYYGTGGDYLVRLDSTNYQRDLGDIHFDELVGGELATGMADQWLLTTGARAVITITLEPLDESDLSLWLLNPDGRRWRSADQGGNGVPEQLNRILLPAAGPWRLVVRSQTDSGGNYKLLVEKGG